MDEVQFIDQVDCRFPYEDLEAGLALTDQACQISANAAFAVLDEVTRPPINVPAPASHRLAIVERIASQLQHPLASTLLDVSKKLIAGDCLSVAEALSVMRLISAYPGQYAALSIAYFSCDDALGEVDREYQRIREAWSVRN